MQPGSTGSLDGTEVDTAGLAYKSGITRENAGSTLYFGNLHACVTAATLQDICSYFGPAEQVKVIKDKGSGVSAGYGFVKFSDRRCALVALQYLNNKVLFGQEMRVNWAFQSHQREDTSTHWHVFVGDLGQDVTDAVLFAAFSQLPGCSDARVMWDHATGRSKGYGFVAMRSKEEAQNAIDQMHGQVVGSRRVRCGWAQHKQDETMGLTDPSEVDQVDPANTNVYIGNIAPDWTEPEVSAHFGSFGPIIELKLHKKGGYGFVRYQEHKDAVQAIAATNSRVICGRPVKVCWGKNASGRPPNSRNSAAASTAGGGGGAPGRRGGGGPGGGFMGGGPAPAGVMQGGPGGVMPGGGMLYGMLPPGAAPGGLGGGQVMQGGAAVLLPPGSLQQGPGGQQPGGVALAGAPQQQLMAGPGGMLQPASGPGGMASMGLVAGGDAAAAAGMLAAAGGGYLPGGQQVMAGMPAGALAAAQHPGMVPQQAMMYVGGGPPQAAMGGPGGPQGLPRGAYLQAPGDPSAQGGGATLFYPAGPGGSMGGAPGGGPIYYAQ